jgi:tetratricopeptide (TPR) repeat protein
MSILKAMISSTAVDLPEHRKQAIEACLSNRAIRPIGMEHLPARDASGVAASLEMVDEADIYIGIYAWRYGWIPEGSDISITEMEFNRAVERGKTILVFLMDDKHQVTKGDVEVSKVAERKLKKFKARASKGRVHQKFKSPDDLRAKIIQALADLTSRLKPEPGQRSLSALHQLPSAPAAFTGREQELQDLEKALAKQGNIGAAIQGMGGVGKTALATVLAHRFKDKYPDAQICLNLRGFDPTDRKPMPPAEAMQSIIHFFQPEAKLPETAEDLIRHYICVINEAGRVLLFLDNAANAEQIKPLVPPSNCLLLVTSRNQFSLPGLATRNIDCLPPEKSQKLLLTLAPRIQGHEAAAAELCGHLPLALEVFAGAINYKSLTSVQELLERLRTRQEKLDAVDAAFQVSYELLGGELQKRWRLLAVFSASFDLRAASAIWDAGPGRDALPRVQAGQQVGPTDSLNSAREAMQMLVNASLVEWNETTQRFRLHDLLRQFCNGKLSDAEHETAMRRYAGYCLRIALKVKELFLLGGHNMFHSFELFDRERIHIEAAFEWLEMKRDEAAATLLVRLVDAISTVSYLRFHPKEMIRWFESFRGAAKITKNRASEANAFGNLGHAYNSLGEAHKAIEHYEQALFIHRELNDLRKEAIGLNSLGWAYRNLGNTFKAIELCEQALAIFRKLGDRGGECKTLANLGNACADSKDTLKAIEHYEEALRIAREIDDRHSEGNILNCLGIVCEGLGEPCKAIEYFEQQLDIACELGDQRSIGNTLCNMGIALARLGETRKAIELFDGAIKIDRAVGNPSGEAGNLFNSAMALHTLGERSQAIACAEAALKICEALKMPDEINIRKMLEAWKREKEK